MAVYAFSRRCFQLIFNALNRNHKQIIVEKLRNEKRNFLATRIIHHKKRDPVLYKMTLAHFYNGSKPLNNVSTYENLVNQKSANMNVEVKCSSSDKPHPGRHKFHKEVESGLNDQVETEFNASFAYLSLASYYGRTEVALPGCEGFFMMMHEEEHQHAIIFLNYILMRGGHVKIPCITPPEIQEWKDISKAFATAVKMESQVKEKLEALVAISEKHKDLQLADFISSGFLEEQNKSIHTMARLLTRSKMVNSEVGEYLFDQHIYESFVKHSKDNLMYTTDLPQEDNKKVYK